MVTGSRDDECVCVYVPILSDEDMICIYFSFFLLFQVIHLVSGPVVFVPFFVPVS